MDIAFLFATMVTAMSAIAGCDISQTESREHFSLSGSVLAVTTPKAGGHSVAFYDVVSGLESPPIRIWEDASAPLLTKDNKAACMRLSNDDDYSLSIVDIATGAVASRLKSNEKIGIPLCFSHDGTMLITRRRFSRGGLGRFLRDSVFDLKSGRMIGTWGNASFSLASNRLFYEEFDEDQDAAPEIMFIDSDEGSPPQRACNGSSVIGTANDDVCIVHDNNGAMVVNVSSGSSTIIGPIHFIAAVDSGHFCYVDNESGHFIISHISQPLQRNVIERTHWPGRAINSVTGTHNGFLLQVSSGENPEGWLIYLDSNGSRTTTLWNFKGSRRVERCLDM